MRRDLLWLWAATLGVGACDASSWLWGLIPLGAACLWVAWRALKRPARGLRATRLGAGPRLPRRGLPSATDSVTLSGERQPTGEMTAVTKAAEPTVARPPSPTERLAGDDVQFTVYRPDLIAPGQWADLLVFAHLARPRPGAAPDAPSPLEEVHRQAAALLGDDLPDYEDLRADAAAPVPREGELTLVPTIEGVRFVPPQRPMTWLEDVHSERFKMRAAPELDGATARGHLLVRLGAIVLADIPLAIPVSSEVRAPRPAAPAESATPYRRIFASYSHKDVEVVHQFERYAKGIGDRYLRDVVHLRAGEVWSAALERLIDEADVFQLFWSGHSMRSPYVRKEWEYALALGRPRFVRPTYWTRPLPADEALGLPPQTLRDLEFGYIGTEDEGAVPPAGSTSAPGEIPFEVLAPSDDESFTFSSTDQTTAGLPDPTRPGALGWLIGAALLALAAWGLYRCLGG
ncbi:MAG: toll/interleukin-1 receptor domain-containing protein [Deltaproteobacteria bacterium]|nr:toll/interleukin-1 receptor domain-containing protein [Deltaproteobacteria bacterium]MCB9788495.1 toll/interleukin-1 receptor domain-containing protein [Deltaproteobacteria bacterium]